MLFKLSFLDFSLLSASRCFILFTFQLIHVTIFNILTIGIITVTMEICFSLLAHMSKIRCFIAKLQYLNISFEGFMVWYWNVMSVFPGENNDFDNEQILLVWGESNCISLLLNIPVSVCSMFVLVFDRWNVSEVTRNIKKTG